MDIVITGRHTEVSERFRRQAEEKLAKVTQLAPKAHRVDVELSHERNPRQSPTCKKVEITVRDKGPVIRAEASADEPYTALDIAVGKLAERLRRSRDRRKVHHGRQTPVSLRQTSPGENVPEAGMAGQGADQGGSVVRSVVEEPGARTVGSPLPGGVEDADANGESPIVIRAKDHVAVPMSLDQALYEMELVGHDFFLYVDAETRRPSVVYRRHGWSYGVIRLQLAETAEEADRLQRMAVDQPPATSGAKGSARVPGPAGSSAREAVPRPPGSSGASASGPSMQVPASAES